jgi:hypothetical protein
MKSAFLKNSVYDTKLSFLQRLQNKLIGNCDIFMKQNILVLNETKRDKILLKQKVYEQENLCGIPLLPFIKVIDESWPTFSHFSVHEQKLM